MKRRSQLFHRGHIQRIEHLRPVHGDAGDGVFLFEEDVGEGHGVLKFSVATFVEHAKALLAQVTPIAFAKRRKPLDDCNQAAAVRYAAPRTGQYTQPDPRPDIEYEAEERDI